MKNIAVIFAGGVGVRMNSKALPKQFLELHGKPILIHTIDNFENAKAIDSIVLVMNKDWIDYTKQILIKFNIKKVSSIVPGGESGQSSIYNGLVEANRLFGGNSIVLIHDGVRPLIEESVLEANINSVIKNGNAITSAKVVETVFVDKKGNVGEVLDRTTTWMAKAPQSFYLRDILNAHEKAIKEQKNSFIDSCSMMQYYGSKLYRVECGNENIKITTPNDYYIFRAIFEKKENEQLL